MSETRYEGILVVCNGVKRSFGSGNRRADVLRGIDLEVEAGTLTALYGPSGSGKTTLLNLIGALDSPTEGTIEVMNQEITKLREGRRAKIRRQHIGFIFQNYTLLPTYTASENLDLALRLPGLHIFERRRLVITSL
jgi:putative ABC transport system ATP-binding protein